MAMLGQRARLESSSLGGGIPPHSNAAPMPPGRSLLLDLPAELRNLVYTYASGDAAYIKRTLKNKPFAGKTCLAAVNKQTHLEFTAFLHRYAKEIHFDVLWMQFGKFINFLNKSSDEQLALLGQGSRKFVLHLTPPQIDTYDEQKGLKHWIRRINQPKKGNNLDFTYVLNGSPRSLVNYDLFLQKYFNELSTNTSTFFGDSYKYYQNPRLWWRDVHGLKADAKQESQLRRIERALRGLG